MNELRKCFAEERFENGLLGSIDRVFAQFNELAAGPHILVTQEQSYRLGMLQA